VGLSEQARSSLVVLSAAQSDKWFSFDPGIDFSRSMPWNQQPEGEGEKPEARSQKSEAVRST
jgi:hypothetical protein